METWSNFPSKEHLAELISRISQTGYSALTDTEKLEYHSYDYAWRRHYLNETSPKSAIDPHGEWVSMRMIDRAFQELYPPPRPVEKISPADEVEARGDYELAERCRAQDKARSAKRAWIVGDGKNSDGSWSEEVIEFVDLALQQIRANQAYFVARQQQKSSHDGSALRRAQEALGLSAAKHDDARNMELSGG